MAAANRKYRLKFGLYSEADTLADVYSLITAFPYATDGYPWRFATSQNIITPYTQRIVSGANTDYGEGLGYFYATFGILNDAQFYWLLVDKAAHNLTPEVTVIMRNRLRGSSAATQWCTVNCKMRFPELTPVGLGSRDFKWFTTEAGALDAGTPGVFTFYDITYPSDSGTSFAD